ncbi:hypothetical protein PABG_02621 [Paracoccidioides brasiliensis Pb03]|nr:hypothetical protein PABG_02621 [Paracoccidioides brasiliensis Pb03]
MKYLLVAFIAVCKFSIVGALGGPKTHDRNNQDFIDKGLRLLQLQDEAGYNLKEALDQRLKPRQEDNAVTCKNGGGDDGCVKGDDIGGKWQPACTTKNLTIRKEWRFLSKAERRNYIDAVYCLQSKPSLFTEKEAPGSKNLFDSFAAFNFLAWHRYFVHAYEKALKDQCGYRGVSPYWEWGYDVLDPHKSPVFDGSPYSMGSDGAPLENRAPTFKLPPPPPLPPANGREFPAGLGGGCVKSGPFSDLTTNLGPVAMAGGRLDDPLRHNPRCLQRDMNSYIGQQFTAFNWSTWTVEASRDIVGFQSRLAGTPENESPNGEPLNYFGVHGGGHTFLGGMTGQHTDFYSSPQEPAFFLHHGQIDRLWSIWQWLDIKERRDAMWGTLTFANIPPSRNGTLNDIIDLGPLAPPLTMSEVMSTVDGPFCYFYA